MSTPEQPRSAPLPPSATTWRGWWAALSPNVRGALWVALAVALFSVMTLLIKLLGARLPVVQILFIRQLVMLVCLAPVIAPGFPAVLRTERLGLHAFRVFAALFAMLAGFEAVVHLPLADVTAISFTKTLFLTVLATLILHEVVGARRWAATAVGFLGVLVIVQPTGAGLNVYIALAMASALAVAAIQITLRLLTRTESSMTIMAYQAIVLTLVLAPAAAWWWVAPTPLEWLGLIGVGLLATLGQWCNVTGFRTGEASAVAPMDYTRILFATALGLIVFNDVPGVATLLGTVLIIGATLYTLKRNAVRSGTDAV